MPTSRRRHTITEVGLVDEAFSAVRALGVEPDAKDLVVRGARALLAELNQEQADQQRRVELRERLIRRTTSPDAVETAAAVWAHEGSWARNLPDD